MSSRGSSKGGGGRGEGSRGRQREGQYYPQPPQQQYYDHQQYSYYPPQAYAQGQQHYTPQRYNPQEFYPQEYYPQNQHFYPPYPQQYGEGVEDQTYFEDEDILNELDQEFNFNPPIHDSNSGSKSSLPSGAMPTMNGKLTSAAAEFWFPECRNCSCCNGYKHGCKCCVGGVTQCSCTSDSASSGTDYATQVSATSASNRSSIPSGAQPTTEDGKLSKAAAEFWFPECRNCSCCNGYKHGCKCCDGKTIQCTCVVNSRKDDSTGEVQKSTSKSEEPIPDASLWYREAQGCECCKGFMHNCKCCAGAVTQCGKCVKASTEGGEKVTTNQPNVDKSLWFREAKGCACCKGFKHNCNCVNVQNGRECVKCT